MEFELQMIEILYDCIIDHAIVNSVINVHREVAINGFLELSKEKEHDQRLVIDPTDHSKSNCDIFGQRITEKQIQQVKKLLKRIEDFKKLISVGVRLP